LKIPGRLSRKAKLRVKIRVNSRKVRRIKRQIAFHHQQYQKEMLVSYRDADDEDRQRLEDLFLRATSQSLAKLYEQRIIDSLKSARSSPTAS
jgi:predicted DNA binding CopG/RHH family protein